MQEIKHLEDKIEEIDSTFMRASLINCERFERKLSNPQEKRMILIEKYEKKLEYAKEKALKEVLKIEEYIYNIQDAETRLIFRYRYIEFKSWDDIVKIMYLSNDTVFRKHKIQLDTL